MKRKELTCCICKAKRPESELKKFPASLRLVCKPHLNPECSLSLSKQIMAKQAKMKTAEYRAETKRIKQKYDPIELVAEKLSIAHNAYTRARDYNKPCISCNKPILKVLKNYHAGHFIPYGSKYKYSPLRFDERNNNGQCADCNTYHNGRQSDYENGMIERFGKDCVDAVKELKRLCDCGEVKAYTKQEMKDLTVIYKQKLKDINR